MIGQRLLHYEVVEKLGEGGMGVVYKARDLRLDRFVALKLLTAQKLADEDHRRRFVQEAKAASSLNHPNILTIHDIGQHDGLMFIVMELVEGKPLSELILRKGMRLTEVLRIAVQVTDALADAHAAGIVHRDLKPANIMVDALGRVKVLDFGLAKLAAPDRPAGHAGEEQTRTMPAGRPLTEEGVIVGSVPYMSPEQAEGGKVDARSDIFSFGAVLYEMLTGRRAFQAKGRVATLAAIAQQEPHPIREFNHEVSPELERTIVRCVRKDPARRFQTMNDLRAALEDLREESASGGMSPAPVAMTSRRNWVAAGVLLLLAAGWWALRELRQPGESPQAAVRLTQDSGLTTDPALSPDGKLIAYASDRAGAGNLDIWIQNVASGEFNRLTTDPADEREPAFSPDGGRVAFRSERDGGGIYVVPSIGGAPRLLAPEAHRPQFSPDGQSIAYHVGSTDARTGLDFQTYVIPAAGGPARPVGRRLRVASHPVWIPDGKHLLVLGWNIGPDEQGTQTRRRVLLDWWVLPVSDPDATPVATRAFDALRRSGFTLDSDFIPPPVPSAWAGDGVLFSAQRGDAANIWHIPLSSRDWSIGGPPRQQTFGTSEEISPSAAMVERRLRLAFASVASTVNIWSLAVDANRGTVHGEPRRLTSAAHDAQLALSADGRIMVFASSRAGSKHIWFKDLENGNEGPITAASGDQYGPVITPDGSSVAYLSGTGNKQAAYLLAFTVTPAGRVQPATPELLCSDCSRLWDISADGRRLLQVDTSNGATLAILERGTRRRQAWVRHPQHALFRARFSPDNRWVSFIAMAGGGRTRVFVAPFRLDPAPKPEEWVSIVGGDTFYDKPVWSPDGNLLYFLADHDGFRCIRAQRLDPASKRPLGSAVDVYHFHGARLSMMNISVVEHEIAVAPGKLLFHLGELTGNIWLK